MRLVAFERADGPHIGLVTDGGVTDLSMLDPAAPCDLGMAIKQQQLDDIKLLAETAGDKVHYQLADLEIALPIASPGKFCVWG